MVKYARGARWGLQDIAHLAAPLEARRPVATSIVFELVRATLCFDFLASNALVLQERSLQ